MENLPAEVRDWLDSTGQGKALSVDPVGGGCINQARILVMEAGDSYFLKSHSSAPRDMFIREAEGLRALQVPGGPTVPGVILAGDEFLLLEDLQPAPRQPDFWEVYGGQLAHLHRKGSPKFGFQNDNYIGDTPQANGWMEDGIDFFRERRLSPQIKWAVDRGYLTTEDRHRSESLLKRLPDLLPGDPAVLIHGDLWSGNLITNREGYPALIDPAVYYGWAEADLAMAELFGSYPDSFYGSYTEGNPLQEGYRDRYPIYNLYHLLNHLNIFGRGYLQGVREVLQRFS